jgi:ATP-dependent helicase/nuclease subunit A
MWTNDQKKVIDLRQRNILVSAAAGSGKTAVLVERIVKEIMDPEHPVDIDRLLVVTFTKAAAGEMRAKIGKAIEKKLIKYPDNERIQRQAALLHNAQITTIDSFCQSIIRNYFHVIGLDPAFRVADETEMEIMKQDVLEEVLEESYQEAQEQGDFIQLVDMFSAGRDDSAVGKLILELYQMAESAAWSKDWLRKVEEQYACETVEELTQREWFCEMESHVTQMLDSYLERAKQTKEVCETEGPIEYAAAIQSDIDLLERCLEQDSFQGVASCLENLKKQSLARSRADEEQKDFVKNMRKSYMDKGVIALQKRYFVKPLETILEEMKQMQPPVRALTAVTRKFMDAFSERKRQEGLLDFSDMEHFALEILVDHENGDRPSATALELQEYYQEIMIDEYQDSSYIQEALLSSLCRVEEEKRPFLFMVGDVKQSIYRFRQARPELFNEKYRRYTIEDSLRQKIDLHQNFRSREMVLASANFLFRQMMQECLGGIVYDQAASLVPGAEFVSCEKRTGGRTQVLLVQEDRKKMDKVTLEASMIGEKMHILLGGEDPLYVKGSGGYRPAEYRDMVILLRSPGNVAEQYIEVLGDMGIPAYSETKVGYFSSMEVETILNFLRVIDNPRQDIPLVSVLRSRLVGLTDDWLAVIGGVHGAPNYLDSICRGMEDFPEELKNKLTDFLDTLKRYREEAATVSVYELLRLIYQETGFYQIMQAMPGGEKRAANLDMLLQRALEYAQKGNYGIFSFVRYIENLKKAEIDFGEASLTNENTNAVRIMSIHKSKGLEFPVVFLAGISKRFNLMDARGVVKDNDYGLGVDYVDLEARYKSATTMKNFLADRSKRNTLAEEIRILYVALTRAKEQLILTGTVKDLETEREKWEKASPRYSLLDLVSAKGYIDWIMPLVCSREGEAYFQIEEWDVDKLTEETAGHLKEDFMQETDLRTWDCQVHYDEKLRRELEEQETYQYPYRAEEGIPVKLSVSEIKRLEQQRAGEAQEEPWEEVGQESTFREETLWEEPPKPLFLSGEKALTGAQQGTLYHLALEHLPYQKLNKDSGREEIDSWLEELKEKGYLSEEERNVLRADKFQTFLQSPIGERMCHAARKGRLHREQQFMIGKSADSLYKDSESKEMILVQGIIDAWFFEDEEIVLVDYKTDAVKEGGLEELAQKYKEQLACYGETLERITGKTVKEQVIYSLSLGKSIIVNSQHE